MTTITASIRLSKSKILSGLQCAKRLWLEINHPELRGDDPALEARLQAGTDVGVIARREWPDGILADESNYDRALAMTADWVANPARPLFEGFFAFDGVRIRPDALVPQPDGSIDLYEVKSSTSVKDYHLTDVTVQAWVLRNLGLPIGRVFLTHLDNTFVYPGGGDYRGLFRHEELTGFVAANAWQVPEWVARFRSVLGGSEPAILTGTHCHTPFSCPFFEHCDGKQPEFPVGLLPRGGKLVEQLRVVYNAGFERRMLRETAEHVPHLAKSLNLISERVVDLWPLTVISWYHPQMKGSWSLKKVLPTVASDLDYQANAVTHGGEAAEAIAEYVHPMTSKARRLEIADALREYCKLDTLAMVRLAHHLEAIA
ncbi:MAG: DUF2779 domain-containing protein [Xanthomonadaceae bacterium]|nr:DUF2779 domain-containing protein [Xanthomonadaceae bacterium]